MAGGSWTLVDVRQPDEPSVLYRAGRARPRTSLTRALAEHVGSGRARAVTAAIADWAVAGQGEWIGSESIDMTVEPVVATDGRRHAAWVAFGRPDCSHPDAVAFDWDPEQRVVRLPQGAGAMAGRPDVPADDVAVSSAEAFRFVRSEDTLGIVQAMLARPRRAWSGPATIIRPDGPVNAVISLLPVAGSDQVPGLVFTVPGKPNTTSAEAIAIAALPRTADVHVVLMDIHQMRLVRWLTEPLPGIAWKGLRDNRDAAHPDDLRRAYDIARAGLRGELVRGRLDNMRMRLLDGGWMVIDAAGELIENSDPPLLIIQMTRRGHSDEPDPVPVNDPGHPGLPPPADSIGKVP